MSNQTIIRKYALCLTNSFLKVFQQNFPFYKVANQEGFVLLNTCNQPRSRGDVKLASNFVADPPLINPNYLHKDEDISCMIRAIRVGVHLLKTSHFQRIGAKIFWPKFSQCSNFGPVDSDFITNEPSDRFLECIIRIAAVTAHHPGGTCAIGTEANDVLDSQTRVRGVQNLRVIDASILPTAISGTPHAVLVAVAQYGADLVLKNYNDKLQNDF